MKTLVTIARAGQYLIVCCFLFSLIPIVLGGDNTNDVIAVLLLAVAFGYEVWKQDQFFVRVGRRAQEATGDRLLDPPNSRDSGHVRWLQDAMIGTVPTIVLCVVSAGFAVASIRQVHVVDFWAILDLVVPYAVLACNVLEVFSAIVMTYNTDYSGVSVGRRGKHLRR